MAGIALIAVAVLGALTFVLFGALVEMYRDIRQLREALGILDRPLNIALGPVANTPPSRAGLPSHLDNAASAVLLFLSDSCAICRVLAAALSTNLPAGLYIVMEARGRESAERFLEFYGLSPQAENGVIFVDDERKIALALGLDTTPVAFRIENGRFVGATTVPSTRYLFSILSSPIELRPKSEG